MTILENIRVNTTITQKRFPIYIIQRKKYVLNKLHVGNPLRPCYFCTVRPKVSGIEDNFRLSPFSLAISIYLVMSLSSSSTSFLRHGCQEVNEEI